ncbi:hypothetical protein AB833_25965 [Chromatiales bacterium (ex Bugula neritina AB1)]|nr:hypothetical protein AB833_25965 [Chromatiales bacterium (ex Bugula neritina AB1)]
MTVLVLAPHADDEVLGVGGTISKLVSSGESVHVAIVTGLGDKTHPFVTEEAWETVRAECERSCKVLGVSRIFFGNLPTVCLDHEPVWKSNRKVHEIIEESGADQLFLPFPFDLHRDHTTVAYSASVAARPYLSLGKSIARVCFYETLTETHLTPPYLDPAFQPNYFVDISDWIENKIEALECYKSQLQTGMLPRSARGVKILAQYRGMHIGVAAAESFVIAREIF